MRKEIRKIQFLCFFMSIMSAGYAQTSAPFVTTWNSDQIILPIVFGNYDVDINNDGDFSDPGEANNPAGVRKITLSGGNRTIRVRPNPTTNGDAILRINFGILSNPGTQSSDRELRRNLKTIDQWGDTAWSSMEGAFEGCIRVKIAAGAGAPELGLVRNMEEMFYGATIFNEDLSSWDVSTVTNMKNAFKQAARFNGNIDRWEVSNVKNMEGMFAGAKKFNRNIGGWDVSAVTNMKSMFNGAIAFNQHIGRWNPWLVTDMTNMFTGATGFSSSNYNHLLTGWAGRTLQENVIFGAPPTTFSTGRLGREALTEDRNWIIRGDEGLTNTFITTWNTELGGSSQVNSNEILLPIQGGRYDVDLNNNGNFNDPGDLTGESIPRTISFATPGEYTIRIRPSPGPTSDGTDMLNPRSRLRINLGFLANNQNQIQSRRKLVKVEKWGDIVWTDMTEAFKGAASMNIDANAGVPNLSLAKDMDAMFLDASNFNSDLSDWDVSNVTSMENMFHGATSFNGDLSTWDVSNATSIRGTFYGATSFNGDLSTWNVSNVTYMGSTFQFATNFNGDLSSWNVSSVTDMAFTFWNANSFSSENYDALLTEWAKLTLQQRVAFRAPPQPYCTGQIGRGTLINTYNWTISGDLGLNCSPFITTWNTQADESGSTTIMLPLSGGAYDVDINNNGSFNDAGDLVNQTGTIPIDFEIAGEYTIGIRPNPTSNASKQLRINHGVTGSTPQKLMSIDNWGDIVWVSMISSFEDCSNMTLADNAGVPDLTMVTSMQNAFLGATSFNGNLSTWDVSNVTDMFGMFWGATSFNGDISTWNVSNVTTMRRTFQFATSFNGDLSSWNVSSVRLMGHTFWGATSFNGNLSSWNVSSVTDMDSIFENATSFSSENYDALLTEWAKLTLQQRVTFGAPPQPYCTGEIGRGTLINTYNWTISGDLGLNCFPLTIDPIANVTVNEHTTYISETPSLSGDTPVGTVTYTKSGNDADDFTLDSTTGVVSWRYTRDYETPQDHDSDNVYEITITATDSDGNTDDESWTVTVANFEEGNSPGGVFDGLEFWIKSDEGLTETSNVITGWTDLSPDQSAITAFGSPALSSNSINFNKAVAFDGVDDHFKVAKKAFLNGAEDFTVFVVVRNIYDDASGKPLLSGDDNKATRILVQDGEITIHLSELGDASLHPDPPVASGDVGLFAARKNNKTFVTYQDGLSSGSRNIANSLSRASTNFFVGKSNENSERLEGDLVEVIIYERKLEGGDLVKIFSYLSIKYGVELDTAIPNYVNSDGTSVFANSGTYVGDVIGIAKDDGSGLDQRISKATNGDGILTISTDATFTGVNSGHTGSLTDGQYLIIGNDGGATTTQATETPGATTSRITREWKVENTGSVGEVNLKFDGFDNAYTLYTDDDGDFSTGATLAGALNANGEIATTFSNGVSYFTLTTAPTNSTPTDITLTLTNAAVNENQTAVGAFSTTDADVSDSHTYTLATGNGNEDNGKFTLDSATGVIAFTTAPDHENPTDAGDTAGDNTYAIRVQTDDGSGGTFEKEFIITVTDVDEAVLGGVSTSPALWVKANEGITENASNVITGWTDQSPSAVAGTPAGSPVLSSSFINFNPTVLFDGTNDYFEFNRPSPISGRKSFTFIAVAGQNDISSDRFQFVLGANRGDRIGILFRNGNIARHRQIAGVVVVEHLLDPDPPVASGDIGIVGIRKINGDTADDFTSYQDGAEFTKSAVNSSYTPVNTTSTFIGRESSSYRLNGQIAELVVFEDALSEADLDKVQTHLAIKYGITLDDDVANYVNSGGTSVFANSGTYVSDIVGIAKDDTSVLDQRISKSKNGGVILTISTDATFTGVNSGHTDSLTDGQYLIIGNDGGATTTQATETPGATTSRITREWKVENTGSVGEVNLKFDGFDNTYTLYTDDDGDFSTGATLAGALNANGEIAATFSNGVSYFTLTTAPLTTWTGTTDSTWTTATNWTDGVPTATHNVLIPKTTNQPTAATAVTVNKVTINSGASLIANAAFNGNITYNRNIDFVSGNSKGWYLMASPVAGETYDDTYVAANDIGQGSLNNRGIATYNTSTNSWEYFQGGGSGTFVSGKGYSIKKQTSAGAVAFTGTLNTDDVGVVLETTATNRFNLLGNPYPSYLNSTTFLNSETAISEEKTLWVWNQEISMYEAKNLVEPLMIAPGQGFFVKANTGGGTFNFSKANQSHTATDTFQKSAKTQVKLDITDGDNHKNYCKIYYSEETTSGFDVGYDGELFSGAPNPFAIYTHLVSDSEGEHYQIQSLPYSDIENMVIPVGVNAASGKEISISADVTNFPAGVHLYLEDKLKKSFTQLSKNGAKYTVTLSDNLEGIGRFFLRASSSDLDDFSTSLENISVYTSSKNNLRIVGIQDGNVKLKAYNILGVEIIDTSFKANGKNDVAIPSLAAGIYIVHLEMAIGKVSRKVVVE